MSVATVTPLRPAGAAATEWLAPADVAARVLGVEARRFVPDAATISEVRLASERVA